MSLPLTLSDMGIAYGILNFPYGAPGEVSFYSSAKGRARGVAYLQRLYSRHVPMWAFEVDRRDILKQGKPIPYVPDERHKKTLRKVANKRALTKALEVR
jgi:hypothetical protein